MTSDRARRPHGRRLSRAESDRLLDVGTGPDSLAALLASAAASHHDEPAPGEVDALVQFRSARAERATKAAVTARTTKGAYARRPQTTQRPKRQGVKVAVAALALTVTGGAAVAATGSLPASLQRVAHDAFGAPAANGPKHTSSAAASSPSNSAAISHPNAHASTHPVPNASPSPSLRGLCVAYRNGVTSNPHVLDNPAFSALVAAAGGVERVANFCDSLVPPKPEKTNSQPHPSPSHPTHPPTKPKEKG